MPTKKDSDGVLVLPFEFKAVGDPDADGYVEFSGYAAAFDNVDLGNDVIVTGAFRETIKTDPNVPILLDHMSLLRETAGFNKWMKEDEMGLNVTGQLNTKLEAGKIAYELSKQALALGKKIGLSIGYGVMDKSYDPDTQVRTLKALKLYEYSFTNFPMNPKATVQTVKSRQFAMVKDAVREVLSENPDLFTKQVEPNESEHDDAELVSLLASIKNATQTE